MLEDRITSAPGRWNQSQRRREYYPYNTNYGNNDRYGGSGDIMDRRRYPQQLYGNRRNYGNTNYNSRTDTGDTQGYYYPRGTYNEDSDDEDIGYLDRGDSGRYKYSKLCRELKKKIQFLLQKGVHICASFNYPISCVAI